MLLQLGVDFLHRLQADADDDEQCRATKGHLRARQLQRDDCQRRQQRDDHEVERPGGGDPVNHVAQVLSRGASRTVARDEAPILLHVVGYLVRVERDGRVEEREEEREQGVDGQVERAALREVFRDPLHPFVVGLAELGNHGGQSQDRGGEDDGDDARHVDLQRDVSRCSAILAPADHALGVLDGNAALRLLDVDNGERDHQEQGDDGGDRCPLAGLSDGQQLLGQARRNRGEDQQRHAVADAAFSDEFTQPHDDARACHHDDDHHDERNDRAILDDSFGTRLEELTAARQGDRGRGLQNTQADRQVTGVLREPRLTGLAFLVQIIEPGDHDAQQLNDDRGRDVGHDAQGEDRQLQQRATRKEVHEVQKRRLGLLRHTALHGLRIDARRGNE